MLPGNVLNKLGLVDIKFVLRSYLTNKGSRKCREGGGSPHEIALTPCWSRLTSTDEAKSGMLYISPLIWIHSLQGYMWSMQMVVTQLCRE
jgi:hypothetical protein